MSTPSIFNSQELEAVAERVISLLPPQLAQQVTKRVPPGQLGVTLAAAIATILVLLLVALLSRRRSAQRASRKVLLAGPCNAGKTTLFYQLRDGGSPNGTVASMQENTGVVHIGKRGGAGRAITLLDVPGHERLRPKLEAALRDADAVVFVVDATDITPSKVEAAEALFEILTHPRVAANRTPILLACNKMDLDTQAHSPEFVRRTLERQLDAMRKTRTSLSPELAARVAASLGKLDRAVSLMAAPGGGPPSVRNPVTLGSLSALTAAGCDDVRAFIALHVR